MPAPLDPLATEALAAEGGRAVLRLPPTADPAGVVLAAAARGSALVVTPSVDQARLLAARLRRAGLTVAVHPRDWALAAAGADVVIGARAAAWAPVAGLAAAVVLDEHDEGLQEERAPTWHARDVVAERARRAGVPCLLVSPSPSLEALGWGQLFAVSRAEERAGWPILEVVDRGREAPWTSTSLLSSALLRHVNEGARVVCVLNTTGRARAPRLRGVRHDRPLRGVRGGRRPARRVDPALPPLRGRAPGGVPALRGRAVPHDPARRVQVARRAGGCRGQRGRRGHGGHLGAGAARRRVSTSAPRRCSTRCGSADVVAFLDFDGELLAPRYRAAEQAFGLLVRAARVVGDRQGGGRILVQTRLPHHEVLQAALLADPGRLAAHELPKRMALGFPPATALAAISGPSAAAFVEAFGRPLGVDVLGPADGRWLLRAPTHAKLCDALAADAAARPAASGSRSTPSACNPRSSRQARAEGSASDEAHARLGRSAAEAMPSHREAMPSHRHVTPRLAGALRTSRSPRPWRR